ncbi:MAG: helix-hairpin-helix domain-containing protein [bacterium]|nr:helix-hairpin-helix domain-containing protein [bacterium]
MPMLFFLTLFLLVDINTATLSQLDKLTGIGPMYAQGIIDSRPYSSVDDLLRVKGIGPATLQKIKSQDFACVNCQELTISTSTENTTTTNNIEQIINNETSTTSILSTTSKNVVIRADLRSAESSGKASRQGSLQNTTITPSNIFLSEILPSPEGSDTENEFIEIFNANNFESDISRFKIKDKIGAVKTFIIPIGIKIKENGFLVFKSSQTKISLNNTGDGVELLDPSGKIIDSTDFGKSQPGQSWSKDDTSWTWSVQTTPNKANIIEQPKASTTSQALSTSTQRTNNLTSNIQNYPPQRKNFLAVGIATAIALSSALIAWRIKKTSTEV